MYIHRSWCYHVVGVIPLLLVFLVVRVVASSLTRDHQAPRGSINCVVEKIPSSEENLALWRITRVCFVTLQRRQQQQQQQQQQQSGRRHSLPLPRLCTESQFRRHPIMMTTTTLSGSSCAKPLSFAAVAAAAPTNATTTPIMTTTNSSFLPPMYITVGPPCCGKTTFLRTKQWSQHTSSDTTAAASIATIHDVSLDDQEGVYLSLPVQLFLLQDVFNQPVVAHAAVTPSKRCDAIPAPPPNAHSRSPTATNATTPTTTTTATTDESSIHPFFSNISTSSWHRQQHEQNRQRQLLNRMILGQSIQQRIQSADQLELRLVLQLLQQLDTAHIAGKQAATTRHKDRVIKNKNNDMDNSKDRHPDNNHDITSEKWYAHVEKYVEHFLDVYCTQVLRVTSSPPPTPHHEVQVGSQDSTASSPSTTTQGNAITKNSNSIDGSCETPARIIDHNIMTADQNELLCAMRQAVTAMIAQEYDPSRTEDVRRRTIHSTESTAEKLTINELVPRRVDLFIREALFWKYHPRDVTMEDNVGDRTNQGNRNQCSGTKTSAIDRATQRLLHIATHQPHVAIAWGNTNTKPSDYKTALQIAAQSARPVHFILSNIMLPIVATETTTVKNDTRQGIDNKKRDSSGIPKSNNLDETFDIANPHTMFDMQLEGGLATLLQRNLQRLIQTGRYVPSSTIQAMMQRTQDFWCNILGEVRSQQQKPPYATVITTSKQVLTKTMVEDALVRLVQFERRANGTVAPLVQPGSNSNNNSRTTDSNNINWTRSPRTKRGNGVDSGLARESALDSWSGGRQRPWDRVRNNANTTSRVEHDPMRYDNNNHHNRTTRRRPPSTFQQMTLMDPRSSPSTGGANRSQYLPHREQGSIRDQGRFQATTTSGLDFRCRDKEGREESGSDSHNPSIAASGEEYRLNPEEPGGGAGSTQLPFQRRRFSSDRDFHGSHADNYHPSHIPSSPRPPYHKRTCRIPSSTVPTIPPFPPPPKR